jgi:hypothetical protein
MFVCVRVCGGGGCHLKCTDLFCYNFYGGKKEGVFSIAVGFHSEDVSKAFGQLIGPSLGLRMDTHPMVPCVSESVTPCICRRKCDST